MITISKYAQFFIGNLSHSHRGIILQKKTSTRYLPSITTTRCFRFSARTMLVATCPACISMGNLPLFNRSVATKPGRISVK